MLMNKEQISKTMMSMVARSQALNIKEMIVSHEDISDGYLYYSFRPVWLGLMEEVKEHTGSSPLLIESKLGGAFLRCAQPISNELVHKNELLAVNELSYQDAVAQYIERNGALVLVKQNSTSMIVVTDVNNKIDIETFKKQHDNELIGISSSKYDYGVYGSQKHKAAISEVSRLIGAGYIRDISWFAALDKRLDELQESRVVYAQIDAVQRYNGIKTAFDERIKSTPRQLKRLYETWNDVTRSFSIAPEISLYQLDVLKDYYSAENMNSVDNKSSLIAEQNVRWVDLDKLGIFLGEQKFFDGIDRLMLIDIGDYIDKNDCSKLLREIGFVPLKGQSRFDGGVFVLKAKEQVLRPANLAKALKLEKCPLKEIKVADIPVLFREKAFERFELNLNKVTLKSQFLGLNAKNQKVYKGEIGRFIRSSATQISIEQEEPVADFLYAPSGRDLRLCAEGFVNEIFSGERKNWRDVSSFAQIVFDVEEPTDLQLHGLQEAIEAAAYRAFVSTNKELSSDESFKLAQNVYYGLPVARMRTAQSVALQQFSTPLPISVVAQALLVGNDDSISTKTVLEPTAGNAGLLFNLQAHKSVVELDSERYQALTESLPDAIVHQGDATTIDFRKQFDRPEGFDYVISNPPFGRLDNPRPFAPIPKVNRIDHYIALRALDSRKSNGRAVLIIGADSAQSDGTIKGGARSFMNYLYDYYDIHGAVEVDGRMYSRQGSAYNIRMLVVGNKKDVPVVSQVPERLPLISTYDELWNWSENCIRSYPELTKTILQPIESTITAPQNTVKQSSASPASERNKKDDLQGDTTIVDVSIEEPRNDNTRVVKEQNISVKKVKRAEIVRHVNEFQAPYAAQSKVSPSSTMIPINMSAAVYTAMDKLVSKVGDVDKYVATKLQYDMNQIGDYFSPEQIDAIALGINAVEENRGMINADQTGIGKGRFVAAMLRYAKLNNKKPVFLTIKPELFTDIFRDIRDINSEGLFKKVFIFNNSVDVKIYGSESEVLYPATSTTELNDALKKGEIDQQYDLVMATYSQFQRERSKNKKSELLLSISNEDTMLILDESHVAAGASQISEIISDSVGNAGGVIYASATPIKGVKNFSLYSKCFPPSVDTVLLPDTLALGGESLQEAISTNMAMDGSIIRREHDYSKLTFKTRYPDEKIEERNRSLMNEVAGILSELSYLAGDVNKVVKGINEQAKNEWEGIPQELRTGNRMNASSMNFGSRLYNITRQFLLGTKTESVIADALEAISEGRKPVVAVENTGESLLKTLIAIKSGAIDIENELEQLYSIQNLTAEEKLKQLALETQLAEATQNVVLENSPQFRDLLEIMLDRIATIKIVGRYGDVTTKNAADNPEYFDQQENLREMIRSLPDLPLSPIDELKVALEAHGYQVGEVSGRKTSLSPVEHDGVKGWRVNSHAKSDAVANVAAFQNGKLDAIIITRSGSTGISLHATDRFDDSDARQRQFIVWQKAGNIAEFLQWMGRVNRKDQVCSPLISNVESGLPAESRQTMMHNTKLRKLSANTTSNRDNENLEGDIDLLNIVGDKIALTYLTQNPDMAENLDIGLPKDGESTSYLSENPFINKLMSRLMMLPVEQQEMIIETLVERYKERIEELEQTNQNPFKVSVFEWNAKVIHEEELVSGNLNSTDSSFDEPVKLITLEYEKSIEPLRFPKILSLLEINSKNLYRPAGRSDTRTNFGAEEFLEDKLKSLQKEQFEFVKSHLPSKLHKSVTSVLAIRTMENLSEGAKLALANSDYVLENLKYMRIGRQLELVDPDSDKKYKAMIVDISFPKYDKDGFHLSKYRFSFSTPGRESLFTLSLAALQKDDVSLRYGGGLEIDYRKSKDQYTWFEQKLYTSTVAEYNDATGGSMLLRRNTLEGNIYRASELAAQQNMGYPALYTDENGNRKRAIIVKSKFSPSDIKAIPLSLKAYDAIRYLNAWMEKNSFTPGSANVTLPKIKISNYSTMDRGKEFIEIKNTGYRDGNFQFRLSINGTKSANNGLISNGAIFDTVKGDALNSMGLSIAGNRTEMSCTVEAHQLSDLLEKLQAGKHLGNFYIHGADKDLIDEMKKKNIEKIKNNSNSYDDDLSCAS
ncbi:strawberry notch C-terminal domain-containing protein [Citrobacter freundii]|nr:strawberry notch C-terminal domain-containing protein [Citrobacter freundii]